MPPAPRGARISYGPRRKPVGKVIQQPARERKHRANSVSRRSARQRAAQSPSHADRPSLVYGCAAPTPMRSPLRNALIPLALSGAIACAHKNPPPDFSYNHSANFAGLTTYSWYEDPTWKMPQGNSIVDGQFIDRHVRESVDAELQKKGYRKIDGGSPSFFVAYHTDAAGVVSQDRYGVYGWWNWGYVDYYGTKYRK